MSSAHDFTWGAQLHPVVQVMKDNGIDPHVGVDISIAGLFLLVLAYFGGRKYRQSEMVEPTDKLGFSTFFETLVGVVFNFTRQFLGKNAESLFFLTGSLTFFILINNLLALVPGFNPPTDQFNTTIVLGSVVFIVSHFIGFKTHGFAYVKHFTGPVWWLSWLILPIELISHLVRPLSLALRLFGNMTGDHKVAGVFFVLVPLLVPLPIAGLGIFVAFVQTFVFLLLTLVYFSGSLEHAH